MLHVTRDHQHYLMVQESPSKEVKTLGWLGVGGHSWELGAERW